MARTAAQIIDDLGGAAGIAAKTAYRDGAVRQWKFKGRIPRTAWPDLIDAFPDLTLDELRAQEQAAA